MHKNATKCNKTLSKWYKNKHGASKIIDTFETYHPAMAPENISRWQQFYSLNLPLVGTPNVV
jgi:hypothetical protein